MESQTTTASSPQPQPAKEEATWYDPLIDIFKMLLELSKFSYGIKKEF